MTINLNLFKNKNIIREDSATGRVYITPEGNTYPSITCVLSVNSDKTFLEKWKNIIGESEAKTITKHASWIGNGVHDICEQYMKNCGKINLKNVDPFFLDGFLKIKPILDQYIHEVYGIELKLYSDKFKIAGTSDLICEFGGHKAILDYKNNRSIKSDDELELYVIQEALYGLCMEELYNFTPELLVTLISISGISKCHTIIRRYDEYKEKAINLVESYYEKM